MFLGQLATALSYYYAPTQKRSSRFKALRIRPIRTSLEQTLNHTPHTTHHDPRILSLSTLSRHCNHTTPHSPTRSVSSPPSYFLLNNMLVLGRSSTYVNKHLPGMLAAAATAPAPAASRPVPTSPDMPTPLHCLFLFFASLDQFAFTRFYTFVPSCMIQIFPHPTERMQRNLCVCVCVCLRPAFVLQNTATRGLDLTKHALSMKALWLPQPPNASAPELRVVQGMIIIQFNGVLSGCDGNTRRRWKTSRSLGS